MIYKQKNFIYFDMVYVDTEKRESKHIDELPYHSPSSFFPIAPITG
ncbi:MAG TPA: hypothetical protein VHJ38_06535 [Nitrososphaeraceae archaeon]|jgi:hypothetical protein|nr:hypothetical protein [Nitrososphaeraceae archaeon]HSF00666.1 hypothetical protein [Nitrososphaeraceae archaeon]